MDALKIECALKHQCEYPKTGGSLHDDMIKFFVKHLPAKKDRRKVGLME